MRGINQSYFLNSGPLQALRATRQEAGKGIPTLSPSSGGGLVGNDKLGGEKGFYKTPDF